jgi:hypothetical protein
MTGSDGATSPLFDARKIIVSENPNWALAKGLNPASAAKSLAGESDYWFTGYCLDGTKNYPGMSLYNMPPMVVKSLLEQTYTLPDAIVQALGLSGNVQPKADRQIGATTLMAALNDAGIGGLFSNIPKSYNAAIVYNFGEANETDLTFRVVDVLLGNPSWAQPSPLLKDAGAELMKLKAVENATVLVKQIWFAADPTKTSCEAGDTDCISVSAADIYGAKKSGELTDKGYFKFTYNAKDLAFDKLTSFSATEYSGGGFNYGHSLWIIEHSYPSMGMDAFLAEVGVDKATLVSQLQGLYEGVTFDDAKTANLLDNYIYFTVQFAMWQANNSYAGGSLGRDLYLGSLGTENELNKVYKYLTEPRDIYSTYGKNKYNGDTVTIDDTNKDKVTEKGDSYIYGPFKATYNVLKSNGITFEVTSNNKGAVSIVDADGKALTQLESGQEFFVKCTKAGKVTNVDLTFAASGKNYSDSEKGTIFSSNFVVNQNIITGLGYEDVNGTGALNLTFNPKTGVPNIAIVFVITLIAFSLGYLALSYNNKKAVELN